MSVNLTVMHAADGAITTTVLSESDKVSALSAAVTSAFNIPAPQQRFLFDNQPLDNAQTLTAAGIKDGDLVVVTAQQQLMPAATSSAGAATGAGAGSGPRSTLPSQPAAGGGDVQLSPEEQTLINQVMNDPMIMGAIRSQLPEMHQRLQNGDPAAGRLLLNYVRNVMMGGGMDMLGGARRAQGQAADGAVQPEVPFDPMSIEGQKAIEERIRQENVNENMHAALEHNPESFGRVVMLFVDCKINTIDGIKAFVDSGAQQTIISKECASRCGLLHLMDTRFQGVARGVGTAKIHGRIHLALMTLGTSVFEITFTVMDAIGGGYDVLLGLDMLRKHAAVIDLSANCLRMGDVSVPFLSEKDIPLTMRDAAAEMEEEERKTKEQQTQEQPSNSNGAPASSSSSGAAASSSNASAAPEAAAPSGPRPVVAEDVNKIVELGFSKDEAENALRMCDGNAKMAIETLLASQSFAGGDS